MNEEKFAQLVGEILKQQLEPLVAEFAEHKAEFAEHKVDVLEELSEIKATQEEHTRLLTIAADAISMQTDNLIKLESRVSALERKAG
jgi:hypothetical protein